MALIVEDGTIVVGADSYVTRAEYIAHALKQGVVIPDTDASDIQLIKAMNYLSLYSEKWRGSLVEEGIQPLPFPRQYLYVGASLTVFPDNQIPTTLKRAQMELALQVNAGVDLLPTTASVSTAFVTREKVDVIETEYSEALMLATLGQLPSMPLIDALLAPLLANGVGRLRTLRI